MLDVRLRKNLDATLIAVALLLAVIGVLAVYSASQGSPARFWVKQIVWLTAGLVVMAGAASVDYGKLARMARPLYVANILILVAVLVIAPDVKGSQRWIPIGSFQFQPSELAKLLSIICLAAFLSSRLERIREPAVLASSFLYLAVPMLLIFKQPDLGTSLVLLSVWFGMTYIAGAKAMHLAAVLAAGVVLVTAMWQLNVLKPYQKSRLVAFIDPRTDPRGAGYQVRQSRIAIGSGRVWGKGIGKGTQGQNDFIPENHTDFIFTVVGEEGGFAASSAIVALFGLLLYRSVRVIALAPDGVGRLIAAGIASMFAYHVIVNIGMTIGIMPVTGVPLPLISYGGSSMLLNMAAIGMLLSIGMRRHSLVF